MRILVITNCTKEKRYNPRSKPIVDVLRKHNLPIPTTNYELLHVYEEVLKDYMLPAFDMYMGTFLVVRNFVSKLRRLGYSVDLYIVTIPYGLVPDYMKIIPYDTNLDVMSNNKIPKRVVEKWREKFEPLFRKHILNRHHDVGIVILTERWMKLFLDYINLLTNCGKLIVVAKSKYKMFIKHPNLEFYPINGILMRNKVVKELGKKFELMKQISLMNFLN